MWRSYLPHHVAYFFPVTKDQITMLIEGNVCQSDGVYEMFNLIPTPFNSESLSYLKS